MYIDHDKLQQDYPFDGVFYEVFIDKSKPLNEQKAERRILFETKCDIQESSHSWSNNFIWAKYAIYFPFDKEKDTIKVTLGDLFEGNIYGLIVNGKVVGVFPSQLGGVTVYVQDTDV